MIVLSVLTLYLIMITVFGIQVGLLFANIFVTAFILFIYLLKITKLDKVLERWL